MSRTELLNILKKNKQILSDNYHINIKALYGSYARNDANENSDVDLVYETTDKISYDLFINAEEYLSSMLNKKVELVNLKYMNPVIRLTAEKDFIYV